MAIYLSIYELNVYTHDPYLFIYTKSQKIHTINTWTSTSIKIQQICISIIHTNIYIYMYKQNINWYIIDKPIHP